MKIGHVFHLQNKSLKRNIRHIHKKMQIFKHEEFFFVKIGPKLTPPYSNRRIYGWRAIFVYFIFTGPTHLILAPN